MSIQSFKKDLWETVLLEEYRSRAIAEVITKAPSKIEGKAVIFNSVSGGTVKDYTGTVEYDKITTTPITMAFDKQKYFAIELDDVDRVQQAGDVMTAEVADTTAEMAEVQNGIVFAEAVANVGTKNKIGTKEAKKAISLPEEAYDLVVDLRIKLDKNKVPKANRFLIASSEFVQLMAKDNRFADNFNVLPNGIVEGATVGGFTIIENEDLEDGVVLALHKDAVGYGMQLDKVEALRLQNSFGDAVRGLQISACKTLRANSMALLYYSIAQ